MKDNGYRLGFFIGIFAMAFIVAVTIAIFYEDPLEKKCAETQGRYDFCVQKVSWEVKK